MPLSYLPSVVMAKPQATLRVRRLEGCSLDTAPPRTATITPPERPGSGGGPAHAAARRPGRRRPHISKRHSDKKGDHLRGSVWTQSGHLASARNILRPDGAHPATPPRAHMPRPSGGLSPVNVASGPPLPGVMTMHGCSEENWPAGHGLHEASPPSDRFVKGG